MFHPLKKREKEERPKIVYIDEVVKEDYQIVRDGAVIRGRDLDGYGSKISTDLVVRLGSGKRYRVYATCCSNVASHWITYEGKQVHLHTVFNDEIIDETGRKKGK